MDEPRDDGDVGDAGAGGVTWRGGEGTWGVDGEDVVDECEEGEEEGKDVLSVLLLKSIASSCSLTLNGSFGAEHVEVGGKVKALLASLDSTLDSSKEEADKLCLFCRCKCCMAASCCR